MGERNGAEGAWGMVSDWEVGSEREGREEEERGDFDIIREHEMGQSEESVK